MYNKSGEFPQGEEEQVYKCQFKSRRACMQDAKAVNNWIQELDYNLASEAVQCVSVPVNSDKWKALDYIIVCSKVVSTFYSPAWSDGAQLFTDQ